MVQQARVNRRERGDTRDRILAAARELFADNGYVGASTRMIARRVGLTDPALYYYFPTKRDLHDALLREADVRDLPPPAGTLEEGMESILAFFFRYAENGDLVRLALREQVSGEPAAISFRQDVEQTFRAFAGPFFRQHYGEAANAIESIVTYTLTGVFWDAILSFGANFEEVVAQDHFQRRLRNVLSACLPDPAELG
ncbi:MAG: hypothetical protein C0506_00625 [Anaerolinea sp.]|nr:hypothetical protein [Anaerolinea sp.]